MGINPDAFYVKSVAVWVPNMLIPNYVPCCVHCTPVDGPRKRSVDVSNAKWIKRPKIMYGVRQHRYLDTLQYKCNDCSRTFTGHHPWLMKLDAAKVIGVLTFFVSKGFAVDGECYSYITNHSHDTTASMYQRLALCLTDNYLDDALLYYRACNE